VKDRGEFVESCFFLPTHQAALDISAATHLRHETYISTLPTNQELLTPFQWTAAELSFVEGLNLGHAVNARRELWHGEWEEVKRMLTGVVPDGALNW
jgi:hypothetical protein